MAPINGRILTPPTIGQRLSTWDRATLIDKYGAKFYHGELAKAVVSIVRTDGPAHRNR
jgi:hypothetical protein